MVKKYGLTLLTTSDETLERYIQKVMGQVQSAFLSRSIEKRQEANGNELAWILAGNISRLVMAIISKESRETLERWQFDIHVEDPVFAETAVGGKENTL